MILDRKNLRGEKLISLQGQRHPVPHSGESIAEPFSSQKNHRAHIAGVKAESEYKC